MIRMAIVGVGGIAAEHLKYFNENQQSKLVAVCDIVQANADRIANQYGVTPYTDFDIMLEMEQLDALVVCVPPFARQEIEEKAVSRGIHLLVEKPLGLEMEMVRKKGTVDFKLQYYCRNRILPALSGHSCQSQRILTG